jgi:hypothetical protein
MTTAARDEGNDMAWRLGKALLAAAAIAICCAVSNASALAYDDILGNWCSQTARLEFSRDAMGVFVFASKDRLSRRVTAYEFTDSIVVVRWYLDDKLTSSTFGEFSPDGKTMFLQPGESVPRREYHRC